MPANRGTVNKLKQISQFIGNLEKDLKNLRKAYISLNRHIGQEVRAINLEKGVYKKR